MRNCTLRALKDMDTARNARRVLRALGGDAGLLGSSAGNQELGTLTVGLNPKVVRAGITLAGFHIEAGARKFADYTKAMIADLGEAVRPYLRLWYEAVRYNPGFDAAGMTSADDY